jgi:site-specific DNA-methyltransferase (adenine-specific)
MTSISLFEGDNRVSLRRLITEGVRVHSCVTDPPYGLVSIQKRFGKEGAAPARTEKNDGSFARLSGGFMNAKWDGTGIERDPEFWRLVWEILLPGGYVFAFSGSRTGHWQAVAMEQVGFIMHPMHGWVFGSGFPKAHSAKEAGPEWEGWAYGTQSQKPALEPIYLGQKPFSEKTGIKNILKHGVGAVNIDGCRVSTEDNLNGGAYPENPTDRETMWGEEAGNSWRRGGAGEYQQPAGRHPANLILDGSEDVSAMLPNNAARFFHNFQPDPDPIFYHPKAGKLDRAGSDHPTVKPIALMQYLIRHITPPGGVVLDPFAGSGTTAEAARREGFDCILMEAHPGYLGFLKERFNIEDDLDHDLLGDAQSGRARPENATDPLQELLG